MTAPQRNITPDRQAIYYTGMGLMIVGGLLFLSTFVSFAAHFGDFNDFEGRARSNMLRALGGMGLLIVGGALMNVGARGWAGAGVILSPQRARKDVEPWSRMAGGAVQDAASEVGVVKKLEDRLDAPPPLPVVKVRCRQCQALNDEAAKFCNQCGAAL